jgi:NADPH-dependent glutamate synthase beta subunit-like oxidoreductase/NAD-dependent dihydropyrimidine dehydrogenase PreA subunit
MKRHKDRLHVVMVIGATPSGIAAVNKLGELAIPVTLVDSEANLDKKFSRDDWRLKSGIRLNHAHRPGLIRIMRNPRINCIMPARVNGIKHNQQGFSISVTREQTFVDPDRCVLCGRCEEICPIVVGQDGERSEKAICFDGRGSLPGRPLIDKRRAPLCRENCPLGVNVQGYIALARAGKYAEALALIRERNILPGVCGRICTHPCETDCRRGDLDDAVSVRAVKRFLSDWGEENPNDVPPPQTPLKRNQQFAVIGSGPAGLAAAGEIARSGCRVTVFEKEKMAGGLLRYGIGSHRLPRRILDSELSYIENLGVEFALDQSMDFAADLDRLRDEFDGVIISTGSSKDRPLGVKGEDLDGVSGCLSFLGRFYRGQVAAQGGKVAVIGDGNAAFDLARTLVRIGADVTIVSWFGKDDIPADAEEIQGATEEGVSIIDKSQVIEFQGQNGRFERLLCLPTKPGPAGPNGIAWPIIVEGGEPFSLVFDKAFVAIGQAGALVKTDGVKISDYGFIETDVGFRTNLPNVFAAGDAISGPSTVVHAMALGRAAAESALREVCDIRIDETRPQRPADRDFRDIPTNIPTQKRASMPEKQANDRKDSFSEVSLGLSESQVMYEAERCLQCGVCAECMQCEEICSAIGAIRHDQKEEDSIEHAGVVIIADPRMAPTVRGDDVIRAYGPKSSKLDVHAMMMRGFAAAAQAMVLLGDKLNAQKGHGVSILQPDPTLSEDIRIGVFVCRCNDSLGWLEDLDRFVRELNHKKNIFHAEVVTAACVPESVSRVAGTVRSKGLTRLVLGSCACCTLDFVCSACTDQRSRLKHNLFTATGISRSMVVTRDIRGEALSFLRKDPAHALSRFKGLLMRSVKITRSLKPFASPVRNYNFAAAVIGESEAAVHAALALAETGMDVFMFTGCEMASTAVLAHPNIRCCENATVHSISGTLGDFRLYVRTGDIDQSVQVGVVIIGHKSGKKIEFARQRGIHARSVGFAMQQRGVTGIPYLYPGMTSISGIFVANPPDVRISNRQKGGAAAVLAAAAIPREPRRNRGSVVVIDKETCRGCGRCADVCPYQAVSFAENDLGFWRASVDEAFCKGCGNCISVCPSSAADSPYRSQEFFEETLEEILLQ